MSENRRYVARAEAQAEFLRMVPASTRDTIVEMLRQPEISVEGLRTQVADHTLEYIAECALRRDLDPELARAVEAACNRLLDLTHAEMPEPERAVVQAACEYYVFDDDADGDFDGLTGLDDDAEVVNAALSVFGLEADGIKIG
ncbi:MAG: hypothetical protein AAF721_41410 [Myxococcota bacterium]